MSGLPAFEELGRGAVLLRGAALVAVVRLVDAGERQARFVDGVGRPPPALAEVLKGMRRQASEVDAEVTPIPAAVPAGNEAMTASEVGALLGVHERTVRRMASTLEGRKIGGSWVFERSAVVAYLAELVA